MSTRAAALNRAFNNTDATVAAFAATVADLSANEIAAANKFDVATLTDAALAKQVMTNMGFLPSTVAAITQLETELAAYFGGMGKGNRGFVVLQLSNILTGLTADATYGAIATAWNAEVAASVSASVPGTYALTAAATDSLVGSSGDDIFTAISSALAANTLNGADKIAAGAGTDTLKVDVAASFAGLTSGTFTDVEKLELTNKTSDKVQFDARSITGVTDITLNSTVPGNFADSAGGVLGLANVGAGLKTLVINGSTSSGTLTLSHASGAAEITGTTDAIAVTVNGLGSATSSSDAARGSFTLKLNDYETANVTASGANVVTFANNTGTTLKTLNIAGSGSITVSAVADGLTTFDASTATGAVTATLTAPTTSLFKKIATGSAVDAVTVDTADLAGNATIDLGLGADTLTMSSPAGATAEYNMTGVETIALGAVGATLTLSGAKTTGLTKVTTSSTTAAVTAAAVNLVSMGTGALTIESTGATSAANTVTSDNSGAATVTLKASSTSTTAKTPDSTGAIYVFSEATGALTYNVGAYLNTTATNVTADKATSLVVDVTGAKGTDGITERTTLGGVISAAKATSVTVTNTGTLGANISAPIATTVSVTNGSVGGTIDLDVAKATSLSLTTGGALALTGSTFTVLESVNISNSAGAVTAIGNLAKAYSVTANGAGASSTVTVGNIGGVDVASNSTVTATGQKLGFTVGNILTASGYNTTVTADSVGGTVSIGDIGSTAAPSGVVNVSAKAVGVNVGLGTVTATGAVTINAAGTVGTVGVTAVSSPTGAVNIDASSVTGVVTLGTVAGKSVVVNLADSAATSTVGAITAKDSANITFNSLTANGTTAAPKTITAATASTTLDVTLKGGVLSDHITVTGKSTNTSIKVAGDLGASTDSITVSGIAATAAQTIDISGLLNYDGSFLSGGSAVDTITGGAGADDIRGNAGADILTGGAGVDRFIFSKGESSYANFDTITDLQTTDRVLYNGATTALSGPITAVNDVYTATGKATILSTGIANFDAITAATSKDTLVECVGLVANAVVTEGESVLFSFGGSTYLFIDGGATLTDSVVVQLTGVNINALALAMTTTGTTGLSGFGL